MIYKKPQMEIMELNVVDVICASVGDTYDGTDENESPVGGSWV